MKYKVGDEVLVKAKVITVARKYFGVEVEDNRFDVCETNIITAPDMTAEEAWEIARNISDMGSGKAREIFGTAHIGNIFQGNTAEEAKAKIDAWEAKQIKVGDVVKVCCYTGLVTSDDHMDDSYDILFSDGGTSKINIKDLKKTGRHIDIDGLLKQIGGDE